MRTFHRTKTFSAVVWKLVLARNGISRAVSGAVSRGLCWVVKYRKGKGLRNAANAFFGRVSSWSSTISHLRIGIGGFVRIGSLTLESFR